MSSLGEVIPKHCRYWRFQGDYNMIGCQIDGTLCTGSNCDPDKVDPTGILRKRIDEEACLGGRLFTPKWS